MKINNSWNIFDDWMFIEYETTDTYDWGFLDGLFVCYDKLIESTHKDLNSILTIWDSRLAELGGDPTNSDWDNFRPLRLSREEDWSDWLAHLFETSSTGIFAHKLLNIPRFKTNDYILPKKVDRETPHMGYRSDIIIEWQNGCFTHIEVKVGDESLSKTKETGLVMMDKYNCSEERWTNYILLLSEQLPSWDQLSEAKKENIEFITWDDVSVMLRKGLLSEESVNWKVWAHSFVGVIEQKLIRFKEQNMRYVSFDSIERKTRILKEGLNNE